MSRLTELKKDAERIGEGWDYDMLDQGKVIDMQRILITLIDYLIEHEGE